MHFFFYIYFTFSFILEIILFGSERLDEIVNPELAINRAKETYIRKGYDDTWIAQRLKSIDSRKQLTDTWKNRGATNIDYAIHTDEIYRNTFDLTTSQYKNLSWSNSKWLPQ